MGVFFLGKLVWLVEIPAKAKPELDQGFGRALAACVLSLVSVWCALLVQGNVGLKLKPELRRCAVGAVGRLGRLPGFLGWVACLL